MHIREAVLDDLPAIVKIEQQNFREPWKYEGVLSYLMRDDTIYLVAVDEDGESETLPDGNDYETETETGINDDLDDDAYNEAYRAKYGVDYVEEIDDGRVVGYIGIMLMKPESDVLKIAVDTDYKRRGIGDSLVKEVISMSPDIGLEDVFLEVRKSNVPAIGLYEKNGFEMVGERKNYYTSPVENALVMKLSIKS